MAKKKRKQSSKVGELKQQVSELQKELRIRDNQIHFQRTEEIRLNLHILHLTERLHEHGPEAKTIELRKSLAHMDPEEAQKRYDWVMGNDRAEDAKGDPKASKSRTKKEPTD